jgi:hypothetical protein
MPYPHSSAVILTWVSAKSFPTCSDTDIPHLYRLPMMDPSSSASVLAGLSPFLHQPFPSPIFSPAPCIPPVFLLSDGIQHIPRDAPMTRILLLRFPPSSEIFRPGVEPECKAVASIFFLSAWSTCENGSPFMSAPQLPPSRGYKAAYFAVTFPSIPTNHPTMVRSSAKPSTENPNSAYSVRQTPSLPLQNTPSASVEDENWDDEYGELFNAYEAETVRA